MEEKTHLTRILVGVTVVRRTPLKVDFSGKTPDDLDFLALFRLPSWL